MKTIEMVYFLKKEIKKKKKKTSTPNSISVKINKKDKEVFPNPGLPVTTKLRTTLLLRQKTNISVIIR
jgi:hypothetical protein